MLDALVVGAGPAGLTLASELVSHGLTVRLIEKALEQPADASRALAIQVRTMEVFERLDVVDKVLERSCTVQAFNFIGKGNRRTRVPLRALTGFHTPYPDMRMLAQHETEALLRERLERLNGKVERGVELVSFVQTAEHVTAKVHTSEGEKDITCRWLLGCDGSRSTVRKDANISFDGDTYDDLCMVGDVDITWELPDRELYIFPSSRGMAVAFPQRESHRFRIVCVLPNGGVAQGRELSMEEFVQQLSTLVPVPFQISAARYTSRYRLHHRVAAKFRRERVFLCGDAGHVHSPVGGQGMNTGIQDAHNLAWKLALVTQDRAPAWLLDTYEVERRRVALKLVQQTDRMFAVVAGHGAMGGVLRRLVPHLAPHLLTLRAVQTRVFGFFSQLRIHYAHSPLTTPCAPGLDPQPGARAPDAPLVASGKAPTRLFLHLDPRVHTLLLLGGNGNQAMVDAQLRKVAQQVCEAFADLIKAVIVRFGEASDDILGDSGEAHQLYGAALPTALVVRPDGYIACRMAFPDAAALQRDLAHRFNPVVTPAVRPSAAGL